LFGITGVPGAAEPADVAAVAAAAAAADGVESAACASRGGVAASPGEETAIDFGDGVESAGPTRLSGGEISGSGMLFTAREVTWDKAAPLRHKPGSSVVGTDSAGDGSRCGRVRTIASTGSVRIAVAEIGLNAATRSAASLLRGSTTIDSGATALLLDAVSGAALLREADALNVGVPRSPLDGAARTKSCGSVCTNGPASPTSPFFARSLRNVLHPTRRTVPSAVTKSLFAPTREALEKEVLGSPTSDDDTEDSMSADLDRISFSGLAYRSGPSGIGSTGAGVVRSFTGKFAGRTSSPNGIGSADAGIARSFSGGFAGRAGSPEPCTGVFAVRAGRLPEIDSSTELEMRAIDLSSALTVSSKCSPCAQTTSDEP
jgi:hypothetical protein